MRQARFAVVRNNLGFGKLTSMTKEANASVGRTRTQTYGRRLSLLLILSAALIHGLGYAAVPPSTPDWVGESLPRISAQEQAWLPLSLKTFFGRAEGDTGSPKRLPGVGPSLFDQFQAVMVFPVNMS